MFRGKNFTVCALDLDIGGPSIWRDRVVIDAELILGGGWLFFLCLYFWFPSCFRYKIVISLCWLS